MARLVVLAVAASALVAGCGDDERAGQTAPATIEAPGPQAEPPAGLTRHGRLLWHFEALLREELGAGAISSRAGTDDFACTGTCSPNADFLRYRFTFARPHGSRLHVSRRTLDDVSFGNYPRAIRIRGRGVACDPRERRFLVRYPTTASFTLDCLAPAP